MCGLTPLDVGIVICIVVPLTLIAAFLPAWEAASVQPVEALRGKGIRISHRAVLRLAVAGLGCLGLGWLLTWGEPIGG